MNEKKLTRSQDKIIMGVCGGLAEYWNTDAWIVRLVCALLIMAHPPLAILYLLLGLILPPAESEVYDKQPFMDKKTSFSGKDEVWSLESENNNQNIFLGILLIIMGLIFLADYYFQWEWASIRKLWPLFLIILGIKFIMDARTGSEDATAFDEPVENIETGKETNLTDKNQNHEK